MIQILLHALFAQAWDKKINNDKIDVGQWNCLLTNYTSQPEGKTFQNWFRSEPLAHLQMI